MNEGGRRRLPGSNGDFAKFWVGQTVSVVGSSVTSVALPLMAVVLLRADAGQLGLLRTVQTLPWVLLPLVFGVWVDRRHRRPMMIGADAGRGALIGLVPVLALAGLLDVPRLYAIAVVMGGLTVLFDLCRMSYLPTVTGRDDLVRANGMMATSSAAVHVAGPGLAGALVQLVTAPVALVLDAVSYLASLMSLALIRAREASPTPTPPTPGTNPSGAEPRRGLFADARDGLRFVVGTPLLRATATQAGLYNFFLQFIVVLFLLYAVRDLGLSAGQFGLVLSSGAIGGLAGALLAPVLARRIRFGTLLVAAAGVACAPAILIPAVTGPATLTVRCVLAAVYLVMAAGVATVNVLSVSLRQAITPAGLLGRMNASMLMLLYGTVPAGSLAAGLLGRAFGSRTALLVAGLGLLASLVPLLASPVPRLSEVPSVEPEPVVGVVAQPFRPERQAASQVGLDRRHSPPAASGVGIE